ncbi:T-cell surface glycoprotein CD3 gamma chain [Fundulus heteroclitus]|uniref:T-cell surface glycoprotein CD3 gamma chain n=1 Tax=Fundulus heteroclitus TaxID=8078 RepID=UPI00165C19E0|nr:T-cell surface glycoprotein CD3 gamma chain [Fundulus heteroclitus]
MKYQVVVLCVLAAFSINQAAGANFIDVTKKADGIDLTCKSEGNNNKADVNITGNGLKGNPIYLSYRDNNTGEYECGDGGPKIFVKFRTCDNCVELDTFSVVGLAVGDVVATVVVGVAVYLIATQARTSQVKPTKKRSDKQNLIRNDGTNDVSYQPLKYRKGERAEYDVLNKK